MSNRCQKQDLTKADEPCIGCGKCCLAQPCALAGGHNPCLALECRDGRYWCRLVEMGVPGVREFLMIGAGCGALPSPSWVLENKKEDRHGGG